MHAPTVRFNPKVAFEAISYQLSAISTYLSFSPGLGRGDNGMCESIREPCVSYSGYLRRIAMEPLVVESSTVGPPAPMFPSIRLPIRPWIVTGKSVVTSPWTVLAMR